LNEKYRLFNQLTADQLRRKQEFCNVLVRFIPREAVEYCAELIIFYDLHLHVENERKSKYGDYSPHSGKGNRISINFNLSKFDFLITFIHELSHHTAYLKYGQKHDPHGEEWKNEFKKNMIPFYEHEILFPKDLKTVLAKHMQNPKYSHAADLKLLQTLKKYDAKKTNTITLSDLKNGTLFKMKDYPDVLKRIEKLRTYILCEAENGKKFRVHAMVEVTIIENQKDD
jgi:SprT protein